MNLYTHTETKHEPKYLPSRIRLSNGMTRTDNSTFTDAEIADAGYIVAPARPAQTSTTKSITWNPGTLNWDIVDYTAEEQGLMIASKIERAVQDLVDTTAKQYSFDNAKSARAQSNKNIPAHANQRVLDKMTQIVGLADKLADWELEVWAELAIIKEDVYSNARTLPTVDQVLAELPAFTIQ